MDDYSFIFQCGCSCALKCVNCATIACSNNLCEVLSKRSNLIIIGWEAISILTGFMYEEISEVSIVGNGGLRVVDFGLGVVVELRLFCVELNTEDWVLIRFHRGSETYTFIILTDGCETIKSRKTGILSERLRIEAIMMMIICQWMLIKVLSIISKWPKELSLISRNHKLQVIIFIVRIKDILHEGVTSWCIFAQELHAQTCSPYWVVLSLIIELKHLI